MGLAGLQLLGATLACALILAIPGAAVGLALRLRGLWLAAAAPVTSVAIIGVASMTGSLFRLPWSVWPVIVTTSLAAALAWAAARLLHVPRAPTHGGRRWAPLVAVGVGVILMTLRTIRAIPGPDLFAQSFDNAFHLSAAKFIVETGTASPWDISRLLTTTGDEFFYPSGWHALVALVSATAGTPVAVASNACLIIVSCAVWPAGAVLLTRTLFGSSTVLVVAAGTLSAGFATYPFMLIVTMGTYPLVASIALLPTAVAAAIELAGLGSGYASRRSAGLTLAVAILALGAVHPSAVVMLAVLTVPIVSVIATRAGGAWPNRRRLIVLGALLYAVIVFAMVLVLRPGIVQPDSLRASTAQSMGEVLFGAFAGLAIPVVVAATTMVGLIVAVRRRGASEWAAIGLWATLSLLYVCTAAGDEFVRILVGGPWYVDATRIAAFTPVVIIPIAAVGAAACWSWFTAFVRRRGAGRRTLRIAVTATALVACTSALIDLNPTRGIDASMRVLFTPTDNPLTAPVGLGPNQRDLIQFIAQTVPLDDVIANNPRDASGFIYPLTGRHLLTPYMLTELDTDRLAFYDGFADADADAPACEVARRLGVRWVVELRPGQILSADARFDGVKGIGSSPNVELVHRVGDSSLYRITGCGLDGA